MSGDRNDLIRGMMWALAIEVVAAFLIYVAWRVITNA